MPDIVSPSKQSADEATPRVPSRIIMDDLEK